MKGPTLRDVVTKRLRAVVVKRGLTYEEVAQRAGCHPKTVERLLEGERFEPSTVDQVCAALGVSLAEATEDRLLPGLELWHLLGWSGWWARVSDVAEWLDTSRSALDERIAVAQRRGRIPEADVLRGVTDQDAISGSPGRSLTHAPRGCTMVAARSVLWLLLTSESQRGDAARGTLIDEGLDRLRLAGVRR